jgi:threonine dehydrogenase-like Zn-dependent dehydrogenase
MKAISLIPGSSDVELVDKTEPAIHSPDEVKMRVWQVGICGTDKEMAEGGRAEAPKGKKELVIGHEMFGQVVDTGKNVKTVKPGDFGVFTVRRGCKSCVACTNNRSDMCYSGHYTERGIKGADGFQAEYVVDTEQYVIKVPALIKDIGVLTEPMSVAAKAIDEAITMQQERFKEFDRKENWLQGKKALVAGIGAIGLMAAFALRIRGADVIGLDIVDSNNLRPRILNEIGGKYVDGKGLTTTNLDNECGEFDFIFEATGIEKLQIELIDTLGVNGIYVVTGIPAGQRPITIEAGHIIQQMVLKNQIMLGSVNASVDHYRIAVEYLEKSMARWPSAIRQVITEKIGFRDFKNAFHTHDQNEIKTVIDWMN